MRSPGKDFNLPKLLTISKNTSDIFILEFVPFARTSVHRVFPIKESFALKIDVEAFNVLNHPVLGSAASTVTTQASFGQISTLAYGNAQRILQFAVKLQF